MLSSWVSLSVILSLAFCIAIRDWRARELITGRSSFEKYEFFENGARLFGALDDLLVASDLYVPFDYKTKGSPTSEADATKYYQTQLDCYALLLEANGMKTAGYGFLLYYSPSEVNESGNVAFEIQPIKIETDIERAKSLVRQSAAVTGGAAPKASANCEYCNWLEKFRK